MAAPDVAWASHARLAQIADEAAPLHGAPEVVEVLSGSRAAPRPGGPAARLWTLWRSGILDRGPLGAHRGRARHDGHELAEVGTLEAGARLTSPLLPGFAV